MMKLHKGILCFVLFLNIAAPLSKAMADEEKNIYIDKISNINESKVLSYTSDKAETIDIASNINKENNQSSKPYIPKQPTKQSKKKNLNPGRPNDIYFVSGGKACFEEAAAFHHVDPWLLMSIAYVESRFNTNARNVNKNGSYDTGLMQINSIWIPILQKKGISKSALNDPCASAYIGAWILADNISRYGYSWRAIGAYNSRNPKIGLKYAKKVYEAHAMFTGIQNKATAKR